MKNQINEEILKRKFILQKRVKWLSILKMYLISGIKKILSLYHAFKFRLRHRLKYLDKKVRIVQVLPTLVKNDAIGNDVVMMSDAFDKMGLNNIIVFDNLLGVERSNLVPRKAYLASQYDILIYHMAIGNKKIHSLVKSAKVPKKIMIYHNITPPKYFVRDVRKYLSTRLGYKQVKELPSYFDLALGDSEFNAEELKKFNYQNTGVLPLFLRSNEILEVEDDLDTKVKYLDGRKNIIFVGRQVFNKKIEDVIKAFYLYHNLYDDNSRLILVGKEEDQSYSQFLKNLIRDAKMEDAIFLEVNAPFKSLATIYHHADLFLCMSEHEGFCVPLIEAMLTKTPIIAYNSTAIKGTLKGAGIIFNEKDYYQVAKLMNEVLSNPKLKDELIDKGLKRADDFSYENVYKIYQDFAQKEFKL